MRRYACVALALALAPALTSSLIISAANSAEVSIHPELVKHSQHYEKKVYQVGESVYSAVGWNIANIVMIEGDDGIILVDAGLAPHTSAQVLQEFAKITDKPIVAVIYSHFHHDHIDGIKGLVSAEQVARGEVLIYAHRTLMHNLVDESSTLGPILGARAGYSFGFHLDGADVAQMNAGIGPLPTGGRPGSFIAPTNLVDDQLQVTISGVPMEIIHVPSEAPDELVVWLPEQKILIDTEAIQGPAFPNMHSLRGTKFRDPVRWVDSIDRLRRLQPEYLVPTHGQPVYGAEKSEEVLRMTRDGIQYVHDQTVRNMNKGLTPDELVQTVRLPPHLENYAPYLRQYYGTVKQAVRQIYVGYLGWFEGDPVDLDPIPEKDKAQRLIALMGGRDRVFDVAAQSAAAGDAQWAAELTTMLLRVDRDDQAARTLKTESFRTLGAASMNVNWRNWYLTSARELDGSLQAALEGKSMANVFMPPDIITEIPAAVTIRSWGTRLKSEDTLDVNLSLGFQFTDTGDGYALTIRRGVSEFSPFLPTETDLLLKLSKAQFDKVTLRQSTFVGLIGDGEIKFKGEHETLVEFLSYFETAGAAPISLTLH